jgi:C1A family cysteine protease
MYKLSYMVSPDQSKLDNFDDHAHKFTAIPGSTEKKLVESPIFTQVILGSCVCQSSVGCLETLLFHNNPEKYNNDLAHSRLSRLFLYYLCRSQDRTVDRDCGTHLTTCVSVLQELGVCSEIYWEYDESKVFIEPPLEAMVRASENRIGGALRILNNDATIGKIVAAIDSGHPVQFGTAVSVDFCKNIGTDKVVFPPAPKDVNGMHAMVITGYRMNAGKYEFYIRNSWGTDFGDGTGHCWFDQSYIQDPRTVEIVIFTLANFLK